MWKKITEQGRSRLIIWCMRIACWIIMDANSILNPWSSILLEKLNGSPLVKKFPAFYGT
jgi:hypothetical protein